MDKRIDPTLGKTIYETAAAYMATLATIGLCVMFLAGLAPTRVTPVVAMTTVAVAVVIAFLYGKEYRKRVDEFLERADFMMLIEICAKAWPFWMSMMYLTAIGVGLGSMTEYDFWNQLMTWSGIAGLALQYSGGRLFGT